MKNLEFDYSKLKGKIIEMYGTQVEFIKEINMTEPTFIKKINSKGYFSQKEIVEILTVLKVEKTTENVYNYFYCEKS